MSRVRPSTGLVADLLAILPADRVSQSSADRLIYSRDMWPKPLFSVRDGQPSVCPPDVIVWPESTEEVSKIIALARARGTPITPFGGGTGVCGAAMAIHGGILVDLKRMSRLVELSSEDHLATFQSGIIGQTLEDELNLRGFTLGHFPASIYCSTLGGWLATRSAGQLSSKYGKIEDMIEGLEVVLGDGRVVRSSPSEEPELTPLIIGSEGTLGIITQATLRIRPVPEQRIFRAYELPSVAAGCEGLRRIMQRSLQPAVMRLYDEVDTLLARQTVTAEPRDSSKRRSRRYLDRRADEPMADLKHLVIRTALGRAGVLGRAVERLVPRLGRGCLAILGFEGEPSLTRAEAELCRAEMIKAGARDLGEGPGLAWYARRYDISYSLSPIYCGAAFADTMEVAATWDRLLRLYRAVRRAISPLAVLMAHFSHCYSEGCSIYFTFAAAARGRAQSESLYDEIWRRGLAAVVEAGGTISHHHGIGLSKASFMPEELGQGLSAYRQLRSVLDPDGLMNPGKMGL